MSWKILKNLYEKSSGSGILFNNKQRFRPVLTDQKAWYIYNNNPCVFKCVNMISSLCAKKILETNKKYHINQLETLITNFMVFGYSYYDDNGFYNPVKDKIKDKKQIFYKDKTSIIGSCLIAISIYDSINQFILNMFENNGKPTGILASEDYIDPSDESKIDQSFQYGAKNFLVMKGQSYQWTPLGASLESMNPIGHKRHQIAEIAGSFGIPPMLMHDDITHSNLSNALEWLEYFTIVPLSDYIINLIK